MCFKRQIPKGNASEDLIDGLLKPLGARQVIYLDTEYYCSTANEALEAIVYSLKTIPLPQYIPEKRDCDDFSIRAKYLIDEKLGINSVGIVLGDTYMGYHAYNVILTKEDVNSKVILTFFEPQTGEFWSKEDSMMKSYLLDIVII